MNKPAAVPPGLTKNQSLVMGALLDAAGPLSAYTILDQLRAHGFRAPLQVYRALDKLVALGHVHRLESLNAFVACRQPECETHQNAAFMICESCGKVREITDNALTTRLVRMAGDEKFALIKSTIELRGHCQNCQVA